MRTLGFIAGMLASVFTVGVAGAQRYDVVASFNAAGSPFSFGTITGGVFTPLTYQASGCVGVTDLSCYNTPGAPYTFPLAGKNIGATSPLSFYTNVVPNDMLFLQSNPGAPTIVRFTAPATGDFSFSGAFTRIDTSNGAGDGVSYSYSAPLVAGSGTLATTYRASKSVDFSTVMIAGQTANFLLDANSNTAYDGTGFQLGVSAVPEPATWTMMLLGFGMVGFGLRYRRKSTKVGFA